MDVSVLEPTKAMVVGSGDVGVSSPFLREWEREKLRTRTSMRNPCERRHLYAKVSELWH